MAIDDNTVYGLTGAQVKELPEKINGVKGLAKVLTTDDYNANSSNWSDTDPANFNCVALGKLKPGLYVREDPNLSVLWGVSGNLPSNRHLYYVYIIGEEYAGSTKHIIALPLNLSLGPAYSFGVSLNNGYVSDVFNFLTNANVNNNLTSTSVNNPLSANQGKILNDKIGGDLSNLTTTDKTSLINAINEVAGQSGGGVTELTSADYNWPTINPTGVALWLLNPGIYVWKEGVTVNNSSSTIESTGKLAIVEEPTSGGYVSIAVMGDGSSMFSGHYNLLKNYSIEKGNGNLSSTTSALTRSQLAQTTGTSTTNLMSQNATTSMIYADPSTKRQVDMGYRNSPNYSHAGADDVVIGRINTGYAIGDHAVIITSEGGRANATGAIAIGAGAVASVAGQMDIGSIYPQYGYNNSNYRLLSGLYDGQSAHDAATYGQVISYSAINGAGAPTTATEGKYVGQLYYDTTNETMYFLKAIDTTTTPATYTWESLNSSVNIVDDIGVSHTDVMSQWATSAMVYNGGDFKKVSIGANSAAVSDWSAAIFGGTSQEYSIAIGYNAHAEAMGAVALGAGSLASTQGAFDIGLSGASSTFQSDNGYNGSEYRLLTGLYDPQNAHDAATKGYVDTKIQSLANYSTTETNTGATWIDGSAIYKKTIDTGALPNSTEKLIAHGIANVGKILRFEGYAFRSSDGKFINIPYASADLTHTVDVSVVGGNIRCYVDSDLSAFGESYITLYYTKSS